MKRINTLFYVLPLIALVFGGVFLLWGFSNSILLGRFLNWDRSVFLWINGHHNFLWDGVMYGAGNSSFWWPFYAMIAVIILREFKRSAWKVFLTIFLLTLVSDQLTSHLIANTVKRLRPSRTPGLQSLIHLNIAQPDGLYGFVSSQSSCTFALTVFLSLALAKQYDSCKALLFVWATLISYSCIYNGVNYPTDVLAGILIGVVLGYLFYSLYQKIFLLPLNNQTINTL